MFITEYKDNQIRCGEHSDYGMITLVFQDDIGGLEVSTPVVLPISTEKLFIYCICIFQKIIIVQMINIQINFHIFNANFICKYVVQLSYKKCKTCFKAFCNIQFSYAMKMTDVT